YPRLSRSRKLDSPNPPDLSTIQSGDGLPSRGLQPERACEPPHAIRQRVTIAGETAPRRGFAAAAVHRSVGIHQPLQQRPALRCASIEPGLRDVLMPQQTMLA